MPTDSYYAALGEKVQWLQGDARRLVWWKAVEKVRGY